MRRLYRRLNRLFSRPGRKQGLAHYVRLIHKLATRLGAARSRARQAEVNAQGALEASKRLRMELVRSRDENRLLLDEVNRYRAAAVKGQLERSPYPPGVSL